MNYLNMIILILVMALITYIIRMIPMAFFRKKIKSTFVKSLLFYMPYAVLSAMTFPYILYSTQNFYAALAGTVVALVAAICKRSLLIVACLSCLAVLIMGFIV